MINYNGEILAPENITFTTQNRAFKYGDALFETMKYARGKILFWEDHYFRLMSSMRILRLDIPMTFSPEWLAGQVEKTIAANHFENNALRVRMQVFRAGTGTYAPKTNAVEFVIEVEKLPLETFDLNLEGLKIDLFKDHYKQLGLLSNLKSANSILFVLASVFKQENGLDECIILNDKKEVAETISSNLFMLKDEILYTPPLSSGCLKGVMRKNVITTAKQMGIPVKEENFSPFELQRATEVFLTNAIDGIKWVAYYRKKSYTNSLASEINKRINTAAILAQG